MKSAHILAMAFCAALPLTAPAAAWGPVAQTSMTTAAAHVLSRDDYYPVTRLLRYIRDGSAVSEELQAEMHPLFAIDRVGAIQREMSLLESVRGDRVDPYFAYRLGVLGRLVVQATAPLARADTPVRARYYADVENNIDGVDLRMASRKLVDPRAYFALVMSAARDNDQTIIVDYQGGVGFVGFARASLPYDASRSINAVADVWFTILSTSAPAFELSSSNMRDYTLGAMRFYLATGNYQEVASAYSDATARGIATADMQKDVGDLFFDAGLPERAIEEYQKVLLRSPGRRDVIERISEHYVTVGDEAMARRDLEDARDAYAAGLDADTLHPNAQRKLLEVEALIYARDERLIAQRLAASQAREYEDLAEEAALRRDYARAITLLRDAERKYREVTGEFPAEARMANLGQKNVGLRMQELKSELITNAQALSGTGFRFDARSLAAATGDRSEDALRDLHRREYEGAVQALREQVTRDLNRFP